MLPMTHLHMSTSSSLVISSVACSRPSSGVVMNSTSLLSTARPCVDHERRSELGSNKIIVRTRVLVTYLGTCYFERLHRLHWRAGLRCGSCLRWGR